MNEYYMEFTGAIVVTAENEDEAFELFNAADVGINSVFEYTDDITLYKFRYRQNTLTEM